MQHVCAINKYYQRKGKFMHKDKEIIAALNKILKNELTAINQYFLHARILKYQGLVRLADIEYKESIDEMKHADQLVERILYLGGLPNLQDLGKIFVGETVEEILQCDMKLEEIAHADLKTAITLCDSKEDYATSELLTAIQVSEEEHADFIRKQLGIIASIGAPAYMQTLLQ
jgi:bacterioferritin